MARGGADAAANALPMCFLDKFQNTGNRADPIAPDPIAINILFFGTDEAGFLLIHRPAQQITNHGIRAQPAFADMLWIGTVEAMALRDFPPGGNVQAVGIDEDAIQIENIRDNGRHFRHGLRPDNRP